MEQMNLRLGVPRPSNELGLLVDGLWKDLEGMSNGSFDCAAREHRLRSPFLPTAPDILNLDRELSETRYIERSAPALPAGSRLVGGSAFWLPLIFRSIRDKSGKPHKTADEIMQEVREHRQAGKGQYPDPATINIHATGTDGVPF